MLKKLFYTIILASSVFVTQAQEVKWNTPGAGNPFIPGYFADPTVKKFGDTYYVYATTDGSGAGFGPSQVWCSKDFENWTLMPMNWPDSHWIWAPDVMKHSDGTYRLFYCQPCNIYEGISTTPRGPWKNVLGESDAGVGGFFRKSGFLCPGCSGGGVGFDRPGRQTVDYYLFGSA